MNIKKVEKKDIEGILDLFIKSDPRHIRNNNFYKWRNFNSSFGESFSYIMLKNKKIIGHYSILPQEILMNDKIILAGLGQQAVIHPNYRDLKNIVRLVEFSLYDAAKNGLELVYGFPNKNFCLVQEKILKWEKISKFNSREYLLMEDENMNPSNTSIKYIRISGENYNKYFNEIKVLLKNRVNNKKILMNIDSEYVKWRFLEDPNNNYPIWIIKKGNKVIGLIVLKIFYNERRETVGHIIEYINIYERYNEEIYSFINNYFKKIGVKKILDWRVDKNLEKFFKLKERSTNFETNFYTKNLSLKTENYRNILDIKNWNLEMHFSDAF